MGFAETRQALADALGTVDGVDSVVSYLDGTLQPRQGVVQLHQPLTGPDRFAGAEWHIFVILDQETETGDRYMDSMLDEFLTVMSRELSVTGGVDIVGINVGGQSVTTGATIPALRLRGIRER